MFTKKLREKPKAAIESSYIFLNSSLDCSEGCRVEIHEELASKASKFTLPRLNNSNDYFSHYIPNNAGHVTVENPQEGTIVITPPMNGCALEFRYFYGYTFYHDANGKAWTR